MKKIFCFIIFLLSFILLANIKSFAYSVKVGDNFTYPSSIPAPSDPDLGTATIVSYQYTSTVRKPIESEHGSYTKYSNFPDNYVTIFKYPKVVNMPIERGWSDWKRLVAGGNVEEIFIHSFTETTTIEHTTELELKVRVGADVEGKVSLGPLQIKGSAYLDVESFVNISINKTYSKQVFIQNNQIINTPIYETGAYMMETRGNFNVYVIQVLKPNYSIINYESITNWLGIVIGHKWTYKVTSFTVAELSTVISYISGSNLSAFYKYRMDETSAKYVYDDEKISSFVYY